MFEQFSQGVALENAKKTALNLLSQKGEANARSIASKFVSQFKLLDKAQQLQFFEFLSQQFSPDPAAVLQAAQNYSENANDENLIKLFKVVEPARQELLRRINRAPDGTQTIVRMRERLLEHAKTKSGLKALDADMQHLLGSWFNPGFWNCMRLLGPHQLFYWKRSSIMSQFMPLMAGMTYAEDYNLIGAATVSFIHNFWVNH